MSLRRRLQRIAQVGVSLGVAAAVGSGIALTNFIHHQRLVTQDYYSITTLAYRLSDIQAEQRFSSNNYAVTGEADILTQYQKAVEEEKKSLDALESEAQNIPEVLSKVRHLRVVSDEWRAKDYDQRVTKTTTNGPTPITPQERATGIDHYAQISAARESLIQAATTKRASGITQLKHSTFFVISCIILLLALVFGIIIFFSLALRRWITRPLEKLETEISYVTNNDVNHPVHAQGIQDIKILGEHIETMRTTIVKQYTLATQAQRRAESANEIMMRQAEDLRLSNQDLEQFAYVASHDLQEPLRKVSSFCQMLERRYKGQLDERADQYISFAVDGAQRMQVLINDLLMFSRVGRKNNNWGEVDLNQCLAQALHSLATVIEESQVHIHHDQLPTVKGDHTLLAQVFQNLVGNAIKFNENASPEVKITVLAVQYDNVNYWELVCEDNGIGIESQFAEKIFVIFQRLHGRNDYSGTGIGLALCKKIVEYHGGRIWLEESASESADSQNENGSPRGTTGARFHWILPQDLSREMSQNPSTSGLPTAADLTTPEVAHVPPTVGVASLDNVATTRQD